MSYRRSREYDLLVLVGLVDQRIIMEPNTQFNDNPTMYTHEV